MLKSQRDAEANEASLLVENHRTLSLGLRCTPQQVSRMRGLQVSATASNLECSSVLRLCCLLQNPCFLMVSSL